MQYAGPDRGVVRLPWRRRRDEPVSREEALKALHDQERDQRSLNKTHEPIGDSRNDFGNAVNLGVIGGGTP